MTDSLPPKFPMMTPPIMTPEDMQKASEKAMNFWVGALSPMWVPFWAASSFGLSAWAMTRNMKPAESLMSEIPAGAKWPSLFAAWGLEAGELHEKAVEAVVKTAKEAAPEPEVVAPAMEAAEAVAETVIDPVIEVPVVVTPEPEAISEPAPMAVAAEMAAVVDKTVETAAEAAPAAKVEPKPIAKTMSAARKPRSKA
ncbi:hypothetical protein [Asticcacaulis sp. EMRT-3]|uniref:hypothetical protein n=1 Tax=Asticcacaulis sp. EMRT-3 TaxID=3040349 RepID=UPI0024AE8F9E|nr:hypothetical protein [Asticcacaulis sp. EMRT-3]MDI7774988.1 hypothetical protein [Asticcacaulis sp. EMRT-3]